MGCYVQQKAISQAIKADSLWSHFCHRETDFKICFILGLLEVEFEEEFPCFSMPA